MLRGRERVSTYVKDWLQGKVVAYGEIAANSALIATVAGGAFIGGINAAAFQDGNHLLELTDSSGYKATGFISSTPPGGLTVGANLLTGWTNSAGNPYETFTTVAENITSAINTAAGSTYGLAYSNQLSAAATGKLFQAAFTETLNSGVAPDFMLSTVADTGDTTTSRATAAGANTLYFTWSDALLYGVLWNNQTLSNFALASTTIKQVTDVAITGALIVSAQGGATRAWTSKDASFNPDAAMSYRIYRLPTSAEIEKQNLISKVYNIVTDPANLRLFLIFDETGAATTITDNSTIGGGAEHVTTLRDGSLDAIAASTCTPGVTGFAPYLTMDATHLWNTPDAADLSFGDGAGNDSAFSVVFLGSFSDATASTILAKGAVTGNQFEYFFNTNTSTDVVEFATFTSDASAFVGKTTAAITAYENQFITLVGTYSGNKLSSGFNIYLNGAAADIADFTTGVYTGMTPGTAVVGDYWELAGVNEREFKGKKSVVILIAEELSSDQVTALNTALRTFAGLP